MKLQEFGRREMQLVSRVAEVEEKDRGLKTKEKEIEAREQWLMQKEGEQRALGGGGSRKQLTPRDTGSSPRYPGGGTTPRDAGLHHALAPIDQALEERLEAEEVRIRVEGFGAIDHEVGERLKAEEVRIRFMVKAGLRPRPNA